MPKAPSSETPLNAAPQALSLSAQLLLARLDLETERLIAQTEAIVMDYANREAQMAAQEDYASRT